MKDGQSVVWGGSGADDQFQKLSRLRGEAKAVPDEKIVVGDKEPHQYAKVTPEMVYEMKAKRKNAATKPKRNVKARRKAERAGRRANRK